jgi:hypothetical protein
MKLVAAIDDNTGVGFLYTSTDGGNTWDARATANQWRSVASSSDGTILYAAGAALGTFADILYRSTNSGATWQLLLTGITTNFWDRRSLACSADGTVVFAVGSYLTTGPNVQRSRVWRSLDGGVSWSVRYDHNAHLKGITCSPDGASAFMSAPANGLTFFNNAILRSTDSGETFNLIPGPELYGLAYSANGKLFAAGTTSVQVSIDLGVNWTALGPAGSFKEVAASPDGAKLIAAGDATPIYWSLDGGATWSSGGPTGAWHGLSIGPDGSRACAALQGGQIYNSTVRSISGSQGTTASFIYAGSGVWRPVDLPGSAANIPYSTVTRDGFGNFEAGAISATALQVGSTSVPNAEGMIQLSSRSGLGVAARNWEIGIPETDDDLTGEGYSFVINDLGNGVAPELTVKYGSGNVGIGTVNPVAKLDVNGLANFRGGINATGTFNLNTVPYQGVTAFIRAQAGDNLPLAVQGTNSINLLLVETNGNVTAAAFVTSSDRHKKTNFASVSSSSVLAKVATLPIQRWSFKADSTTSHLGPMAQDFYAAFGLGADDKHIATVDADGVALAAIQGLNEKVENGNQKAEIRNLRSEARLLKLEVENADLKSRLEKLERLVNEKPNGAVK